MNILNAKIKIQIRACEANPSPPIGPALGAKGVNIIKFCNEFNEKTKNIKHLKKGTLVPTIINVYKDKSFDFIIKSPTASFLIKETLGLDKGSNTPNKNKIATITQEQLQNIVNKKESDLIVNSNKAAIKTIIGTALSMGITINETKHER